MLESLFNKVAGLKGANSLKRSSTRSVFLWNSRRFEEHQFEKYLHKSLFENSMSVSDAQRILWSAAEKFCNLLILLNLYFYITLGTLFIWTMKIIKCRWLAFEFICNVFIVLTDRIDVDENKVCLSIDILSPKKKIH